MMHARELAFATAAALALTLGLPGCAAPDPESEGVQPSDSEDDDRGLPAFRALDRDDDGEISPNEIGTAPESLASLDDDGDGTLSGEELLPAGERPSRRSGANSAGSNGTFMTGGTGGAVRNGAPEEAELPSQTFVLSAEEGDAFNLADMPPQLRSYLAGADTDGDGAASAAEIMALMGAQGGGPGGPVQAETDGREAGTPQDASGRPQPASRLMAALDADQDGAVSAEEIASAAQSLRGLDTNRDGRLSASELQPVRRTDWSGIDRPE